MTEGLRPASSSAVLGRSGTAGWVYDQAVKDSQPLVPRDGHSTESTGSTRNTAEGPSGVTEMSRETRRGTVRGNETEAEMGSLKETEEHDKGYHSASHPDLRHPTSSAHEPMEGNEPKRKHNARVESPWAFSLDLAAGGAVACVAHTAVAPIERIKLVLQTQDANAAMLSGRHRRYRGFFDALGTMVREEGVWSLWRGNLTSVIRYIPSMALNFAFKDYYRLLYAPSYADGPPSAFSVASRNMLAGASAGATSLFFTYPLDIAHTRLATDVGTRKQFTGLPNFLRLVYRREGLRGLYHGFPASVHGIVVHRAIYFGGFDSAKQLLLSPTQQEHAPGGTMGLGGTHRAHAGPLWMRWVLAQGATTTASLISYPFDTVRHRMMMQSCIDKPEYMSTVDCWRKIFQREGVRGFYKGLMSNILRGTGAAFVLVAYDELQGHVHKALHVD